MSPPTAPHAVASNSVKTIGVVVDVLGQSIAAIMPPVNVKAAHRQLATAVKEFADELSPLVTKLKAGSMHAVAPITSLKGLTDILTAVNVITAAGYKIRG